MKVQSISSWPCQAAAFWLTEASLPGRFLNSSTPSTSTQSYRPASISAMAVSTASDEDAQAPSCRMAGTPHSGGTTWATMAPRCACWRCSSPNALPTWMLWMSEASTALAASVPSAVSRVMSEMSCPARDQTLAKSVWWPPRM